VSLIRRPGARFNRGRIATVAGAASSIPAAQDLRLLSASSADIVAWYRAENNVTLNPILLGSGTSPPVATITGNLAQTLGLSVRMESGSNTLWRWSVSNGWDHWLGGQSIPVASGIAGYALGSTGLTLTFANTAFTSDNVWDACAASWGSIVGAAGAAGTLLDNSTVAATNGPYVMAKPLISPNGDVYRPSLRMVPNVSTGYLGNQGTVAAAFSGTTKTWHTFQLMRLNSINISTLPVATWSASDTVSTTQKYVTSVFYGAAAAGGARYEMRKRVDAGGTVLAATWAIPLDFKWFIHEHACDGNATTAALTFLNSGQALTIGGTWGNGATTVNRYVLGALKLGAGAAANQPYFEVIENAIYNRNLTTAEADAVRTRMAWAG
jgi:hypothetical protein